MAPHGAVAVDVYALRYGNGGEHTARHSGLLALCISSFTLLFTSLPIQNLFSVFCQHDQRAVEAFCNSTLSQQTFRVVLVADCGWCFFFLVGFFVAP